MTIVDTNEMWSRRSGTIESDDGRTFRASFEAAYQVVHSADATEVEKLAAVGIALGDLYPGTFGVFALGDVGRVYLEGESSDTWHTGVGGGLWFAYLEPANTITIAVARGVDRTALYIRAGFAY